MIFGPELNVILNNVLELNGRVGMYSRKIKITE